MKCTQNKGDAYPSRRPQCCVGFAYNALSSRRGPRRRGPCATPRPSTPAPPRRRRRPGLPAAVSGDFKGCQSQRRPDGLLSHSARVRATLRYPSKNWVGNYCVTLSPTLICSSSKLRVCSARALPWAMLLLSAPYPPLALLRGIFRIPSSRNNSEN